MGGRTSTHQRPGQAGNLSGSRNFGGGIVDCELINPLYEEHELKRTFNRANGPTAEMEEKDEQWAERHRPQIEDALADRLHGDLT